MGGDDSQKLLPWRGIHSSPGRKPPAQLRINNVTETAGWNLALTPPSLAGLAVASATGRLGHFWKAHPGQFWRAPKGRAARGSPRWPPVCRGTGVLWSPTIAWCCALNTEAGRRCRAIPACACGLPPLGKFCGKARRPRMWPTTPSNAASAIRTYCRMPPARRHCEGFSYSRMTPAKSCSNGSRRGGHSWRWWSSLTIWTSRTLRFCGGSSIRWDG